MNDDNAERRILLVQLFTGELRVVKLPWKPNLDEKYWMLDITIEKGYGRFTNSNCARDKRIFKYVIIAKTEEEIIEIRNKQEWWNE